MSDETTTMSHLRSSSNVVSFIFNLKFDRAVRNMGLFFQYFFIFSNVCFLSYYVYMCRHLSLNFFQTGNSLKTLFFFPSKNCIVMLGKNLESQHLLPAVANRLLPKTPSAPWEERKKYFNKKPKNKVELCRKVLSSSEIVMR